MNATAIAPMSLEAFLDWERLQESKYEFDGYRPIAMPEASAEHLAIRANLRTAIGARLLAGACRMYGGDLKLAVAGSIRYPDAIVVRAPVPLGTLMVSDPVIVFEVLCPDVPSFRLFQRNREYRDTPSVQRYVVLEQARPEAAVYYRARGLWVTDVVGFGADLELPEVELTVPLAALYRGVVLPPVPPSREGAR